ncbi:MAG: hypothetical protein V1874_16040 [Spirochaetota bacterium]
MLITKKVSHFVIAVVCMFLFMSICLYAAEMVFSTNIDYKPIEIESLSRYNEDRVAFQHISLPGRTSYKEDNSIASLLIVKNNQIYLFRDGYDDAKKIETEGYIQEIRRELPKDLWVNRINSKPDFLKIADRRTLKLFNVTEEYVEKNYGEFYRNVRNSFINKHVQIFRSLMKDKIESSFYLERKPISPPAFQEVKESTKFITRVSAKALNDTMYYAEDNDGDNITETFYVTFDDGYNWGYKSGPNIIFIYNNKEDDIKQLIGKICNEAYYGTSEEEKLILKTFPKESEIIETFKLEKVTLQAIQSEKSAPATSGTK